MFKPVMNFVKRVFGGERKPTIKPESYREKVEIPMPESPSSYGMVTIGMPEREEKRDAKSPFYGLFNRGDTVLVLGIGKRSIGRIVGRSEVRAVHPTKGLLTDKGWRQPHRVTMA